MTARTPSPMAAARGLLEDAAAVHVAHRHICRTPRCGECVTLARTVLRLQQQVGLMRFARASDEDLEVAS